VLPLYENDRVLLDVIGELAAHAAVRTHRLDFLVGDDRAHIAGRHQCARRTRLHAFAARDAGGIAHRIVQIEDDLRLGSAEGIADDVVYLRLAAGADAAAALDAGIQMDSDRRMRQVLRRLMPRPETRLADAELLRPQVELGIER